MFDGNVRSRRNVNLRGATQASRNVETVVEYSAEERQKRAEERKRQSSVLIIQSFCRCRLSSIKLKRQLRNEFDVAVATVTDAVNNPTVTVRGSFIVSRLRELLIFCDRTCSLDLSRVTLISDFIVREFSLSPNAIQSSFMSEFLFIESMMSRYGQIRSLVAIALHFLVMKHNSRQRCFCKESSSICWLCADAKSVRHYENSLLKLILHMSECLSWPLYNATLEWKEDQKYKHNTAMTCLCSRLLYQLTESVSFSHTYGQSVNIFSCLGNVLRRTLPDYRLTDNNTLSNDRSSSVVIEIIILILMRAIRVGAPSCGQCVLSEIFSIPLVTRRCPTSSLTQESVWIPLIKILNCFYVSEQRDKKASHSLTTFLTKSEWCRDTSPVVLGNLIDILSDHYESDMSRLLTDTISFINSLRFVLTRVSHEWFDDPGTLCYDGWEAAIHKQLIQLYSAKFIGFLFDSVSILNDPTSLELVCEFYLEFHRKFPSIDIPLLNALSFSTSLISSLWGNIKNYIKTKGSAATLAPPMLSVTHLFALCYSHLLVVLEDDEFYKVQKPLSLGDNAIIVKSFLNLVVENRRRLNNSSSLIFLAIESLLQRLYARNSRSAFVETNAWLATGISAAQFIESALNSDAFAVSVLKHLPFAVSFETRLSIFRAWIEIDKKTVPPSRICLQINRNNMVGDGVSALSRLRSEDWKARMHVTFTNAANTTEAGIDMGGLFKEFASEILTKGFFNPTFGLFTETSDKSIYISPTSVFVSQYLQLLDIAGKLLGRCIYEQILLNVQFAPFFRKRLLGFHSFFDDLSLLDSELFRNLQWMKKNDASDLSLTMSINTRILGAVEERDLVVRGRSVAVTNENKTLYLYLVANYKLNVECQNQARSFMDGLFSIIKREWLGIFSPAELQLLISGDMLHLDVSDLRRHTKYSGGYHDSHVVINKFWEVMESLSEDDKSLFLKYVTSVSRCPIGGFVNLHPPFTIHMVDCNFSFFSFRDSNRLPTSSTCFNTLKLPNYKRSSTLKEKLLYAIRSQAGFEMS